MFSSKSKSSLPTIQNLKAAIPNYISTTDQTITRINRLLAETSSLDTTLLTLSYTLHLLHSTLLFPLSKPRLLSSLASKIPSYSSLSTTISITPFLNLAKSTVSLASLIDDIRIFLRLGGLFGIYGSGRKLWKKDALTNSSSRRERLLRYIAATQVLASALFQGFENGAYLAQHGVLRWKEERVNRWYVLSSRFWMVYVALEGGRLGVDMWMGDKGEEEEGRVLKREEKKEADEKWWRDAFTNAAYAPMTVHYSLEGGCLGEGQVGLLGLIAGVVGIRDAWRRTV